MWKDAYVLEICHAKCICQLCKDINRTLLTISVRERSMLLDISVRTSRLSLSFDRLHVSPWDVFEGLEACSGWPTDSRRVWPSCLASSSLKHGDRHRLMCSGLYDSVNQIRIWIIVYSMFISISCIIYSTESVILIISNMYFESWMQNRLYPC